MIKYDSFDDMVENAYLLLRFALEKKDENIDNQHINNVVNAVEEYKKDTLNQEQKANFLASYQVLHKSIYPSNLGQIIATNKRLNLSLKGRKAYITQANLAVFNYSSITIAVFLVTVFLSIYLFIIQGVFANVTNLEKERTKLAKELSLLQNSNSSSFSTITAKNNELKNCTKKQAINNEMLAYWADWFPTSRNAKENNDFTDKETEFKFVQESVQYPILMLNSYILPMLFGLLGALVFVLRSLYNDINENKYSRASNAKYNVRLTLGFLSGLIIGFVFIDSGNGEPLSFKSFSPFGLSFIAGYSIEFLLDSITNFINNSRALTGKKTT